MALLREPCSSSSLLCRTPTGSPRRVDFGAESEGFGPHLRIDSADSRAQRSRTHHVLVAADWIKHRVQSRKKHIQPTWEYGGESDPTRETSAELRTGDIRCLMKSLFASIGDWPRGYDVKSYELLNPRPEVMFGSPHAVAICFQIF